MDGEGKITHKNGNVWEGQFKHDRKEGKGQALKAANAGVHKGIWKAGERTPNIKFSSQKMSSPSPNSAKTRLPPVQGMKQQQKQ